MFRYFLYDVNLVRNPYNESLKTDNRACSSVWIERLPSKPEVEGSKPSGPARSRKQIYTNFMLKFRPMFEVPPNSTLK